MWEVLLLEKTKLFNLVCIYYIFMAKTRKSNNHKKSKRTKKLGLSFNNLDLYLPKELTRLLNLYPHLVNNKDIINGLNMLTVTKNSTAQNYINNAIIELYNFDQIESCNNFLMAALYDKNCAFAYWGAAYSVQLNVNHIIISKELLKFSVGCLKKALTLKSNENTSPVVSDLIDALYQRTVIPNHSIDSPVNIQPTYHQIEKLMKNYSRSMQMIYEKYDNENIAVLYVSSIMTIHPWKWWPQGSMYDTNVHPAIKPPPSTKSAYHILEKVLKQSPDHIGAKHYFIHLVEESPHPEIALNVANSLREMTKNTLLGHLTHVPSHIYTRMGMYVDSITANINALKADNKYLSYKEHVTKLKSIDSYSIVEYYAHNAHFLIVDAQKMGSISYCKKYIPILEKHVHTYIDIKTGKNVFLEHFLTVKCHVYLAFGKYNEIMNWPRPPPFYLLWTAIDSYVRLVSLCKLGKQKDAYSELIIFKEANDKFIKEAPKETCRCGCSKRHGGICNPNYGLNKYRYFRKHNIPYGSEDAHEAPSCCAGKLRESNYKSPKPGGIRSPSGYKQQLADPHIITPPSVLLAASGTLTVNNSVLLAKIRESLGYGYLKWFFGNKDEALDYFKKATEQYEDLQYDEPAAYQSDVHNTYGAALYMAQKYDEALYIIERGEIPYPNQLNAAFIKMLIYEKLGKKKDIKISKKKYKKLLALGDYTPNLLDF
jgi:hypothetical protein